MAGGIVGGEENDPRVLVEPVLNRRSRTTHEAERSRLWASVLREAYSSSESLMAMTCGLMRDSVNDVAQRCQALQNVRCVKMDFWPRSTLQSRSREVRGWGRGALSRGWGHVLTLRTARKRRILEE